MKKMHKVFSVVFGFLMLCACFIGCKTDTTTAQADELSYISMRINPEIELVVDKDGEVVAANAINEDGETVLGELALIGMTAEEAGEAFTAMALELGFIDVNAEEVNVYVFTEGKDEKFVKGLEDKLVKEINGFFDKKGVFGKVTPEEMEEFRALATEWNVSVKDARMISRILELYPEKTLEEVLALTFQERMELIKSDREHNGLPVHLRGKYKDEVNAIKEEHAELFELAKELKALELELQNTELSEEELALLQEEYAAKKAKFDELKAAYDAAIAEVKTEKQKKVKEVKNDIKEQAQERRDSFADELQKHDEKVQKEKEKIEKQIQEWRNNDQ